jgi:hypothetical protein
MILEIFDISNHEQVEQEEQGLYTYRQKEKNIYRVKKGVLGVHLVLLWVCG